MNENLKIVTEWYTTERSYDYMPDENRKGLKIWEKDVVLKYFPEGSHILDIGCGMGREAFALYDMGFKVTGIDISQPIVAKARQLASESSRKIDLILTDGMNLPFYDETFDIVIMWSQTFGLFYGEENQLHILRECRRVLRKGGVLSFSGHDREFQKKHYALYLKGNRFYPYINTECYWESYTIDEILERAKKAGFDFAVCERGLNYMAEDGTILHCECIK
jgi:ubiquinone/menaquinone biosynthesis C-methylase UbiE